MVAYNFKAQFANDVASGKKRHTIRAKRKRQARPGDDLQLYTGQRSQHCRKLRDAVCHDVRDIVIDERRFHLVVYIDGKRLTGKELNKLVTGDGFSHRYKMRDFFALTYGLPFNGDIIYW